MPDIRTQEEIDAKLAETEDKKEQKSEPVVTNYDFKHPAGVNKDQLRTLENLHDNFARLLSSTFSGAMKAVVDVDTAFVDQTTYAEFIMSLSNPSCSYQFILGPTNGQAILDFAMPVTFAYIDSVFGGVGSPSVDARQLSPVEIGQVHKLAKRVIEDLEATWEPILRVDITDVELETNPEFMKITAASEIVILLAFEINTKHASGLVSLCYPFFTIESILPRLGQRTYVRTGRLDRQQTVSQNRERLGSMKLPVRVEMGRTELSVKEAAQLQVGDVVRMSSRQSDPCVLFVGGEPKYYALPFAEEDGDVRLSVTGKIPKEKAQDYTLL